MSNVLEQNTFKQASGRYDQQGSGLCVIQLSSATLAVYLGCFRPSKFVLLAFIGRPYNQRDSGPAWCVNYCRQKNFTFAAIEVCHSAAQTRQIKTRMKMKTRKRKYVHKGRFII